MKFMHIRCYKQGTQLPSARGGVTIAFKKDEKGDLYKVAYAVCSEKDNYCKKPDVTKPPNIFSKTN